MRQFLLSILVAFVLLLSSMTSSFAQSAKTTYDFSTAASLTNTGLWNTQADIIIDGTAYRLTCGGNGSFTNEMTGGASNSACLQKKGVGGDQFTLQRADGEPFQFYGIWVKHESMNSYSILPGMTIPPWYTLTASTFSFQDNTQMTAGTNWDNYTYSTQTISPGINGVTATSVQINFQAIMYFWIDDIIVGPTPLTATTSHTNVSCYGGNNGSATISVTNGTSPYSYSWSPSGGTGATASGLTSGTYICTITDAADNTLLKSVTISQPSALTATGSQTNVSCFGGSNGSASIDVLGGTVPYSYSWSPSGGTSSSANNLYAGTYTCTITDANSCTVLQQFTIAQHSALILTQSSQTNVACYGGSTGAATVNTATGGTGSYTYNWAPGNPIGDGTTNVIGLYAGIWTCTVTDENNCSTSVSFNITQPATELSLLINSQTNVSTNGGSDGSASVNVATGGTPPYSYDWTPGNPTGDGTTSVADLTVGIWTCTVTDANNCMVSQSFTIKAPPAVATSAVTSITYNSASSDGNVTDEGGSSVTEKGICWNTTGSPTITDSHTSNGTGLGSFTGSMTGLSAATLYYVRAFATNTIGTTYSGEQSFTTLKQSQTITFNTIPTKTYRDIDFNPATASSGLTISYTTSNSSVATVVNNQIHIVGPGSCIIYADQAGNASYNAASQVSQQLTVSPNNALEFDGSNDYVQLPVNSQFDFPGNSAFTFESWIYYTGAGNSCLFSKAGFYGQTEYSFYINSATNKLIFMVAMQSVAWQTVVTSASAIPTNIWIHVALVKTSTNATIYLNGIPDASGNLNSISQSASAATAHGIVLGGKNFAPSFYGKMDDVHFWSGARTATEIHDNMCKSLVGNESNLIAYYDFDQSSGTVFPDRSSNSINGTLTNMDESTDWVSSTAFNTWKGLSTDWNSTTNWSLLTLPVSSDNVGIYQGVSNYPEISGSPTINLLVLGSTSSLTLSSDLNVSNNLILENNLNLNGNNILLGTTGTLVEGNGLLWGYPGSISAIRTLGSSVTSNLGGLGAAITTGSTAPGSTTVVRSHNAQSGTITSIKRNYAITPTTNTGLSATLAFKYADSELNGLDESNLKLFKSIDAGTNWSNQHGTLDVSANSLTLGGIDGFSLWTVAEKQTQNITFNVLPAKIYGDGDFAPVATASSGLTVSYTTSDSNIATIVEGQIHIVGTGTCTIYADQEGNSDYLAASQVSQTFTVTKATLTVTTDAKTKVYGDANPTLTFQYSGWKNGDDESDLDTKPTASTTVTNTTSVGTYTDVITVSGGADNNYAFSYVPADFEIIAATLTVTADAKTKVYGDANPTLTIQYSGWKNSDSESVLDTKPVATTTVTVTTSPGTYANAITVSGGIDNNYDFTYVSASFTVNKGKLVIWLDQKTKNYGDENPTLTYRYTGFMNGDDESVLDIKPYPEASVNQGTNAGTYTNSIYMVGGADDKYIFSNVPANFTVTKAKLTVTCDPQTKAYGEINPELTFKYSGWKNGENESVLDIKPTGSTTVNATTIPGVYQNAIIAQNGSDNNYKFEYVPGVFTVTKANQSITFNTLATKTYGDAPFILSATANSGLTLSYTCSNSDVAVVSGNIVNIIGAGTAIITAAQPGDSNYIASGTVSQTLVVNKKPLTIVGIIAQSKIYDGNANATISGGTLTGTINSDVISLNVSTTGTFSQTSVGTAIPVSTAMTISGERASNYVLSSPILKADITAKTVTVTAQNASRQCDQPEQALTYTFEPALISGDTFTGTLIRTAGNAPGVYPISQGSLSLGSNYTINFTGASYTITNTKNLAPVVDQPVNLTVLKNSKEVTVTLTEINPISNCIAQEIQTIIATADNKILIPEILVDYTKDQSTAKLKLKIADGLIGETIIRLSLKDNGGTENGGMDTKEISFSIKVESPVGVNNLTQNFDVRVYPNPSVGLVKIETSGFNKPFIRIFNAIGAEIYMKTSMIDPIQTVDLSENTPGIYFIEISDKENIITKKLILKN